MCGWHEHEVTLDLQTMCASVLLNTTVLLSGVYVCMHESNALYMQYLSFTVMPFKYLSKLLYSGISETWVCP